MDQHVLVVTLDDLQRMLNEHRHGHMEEFFLTVLAFVKAQRVDSCLVRVDFPPEGGMYLAVRRRSWLTRLMWWLGRPVRLWHEEE